MSVVDVAVWGLGPHALKNLIPAVAEASGIRLNGICSRNRETLATVARERKCQAWDNPDEMLADASVEAVLLATPIGLHAAHGAAILGAGKHLWCEKPLAASEAETESLLALAEARGLVVAEGFMYLYHSHFAALRQTLASGRLGRVHTVDCKFAIPALERPGFRNSSELGGGAFLDVGSYPVSAALALLEYDEPAVQYSRITRDPVSLLDTAGLAILGWPDDLAARVEWRTGSSYRNEMSIWGELGSVTTERVFSKPLDYKPRFRFLDVNGRESYDTGTADNYFLNMLGAFRSMVDDKALAAAEKFAISRRGRVMQRIRDNSRIAGDIDGEVEAYRAGR